MIKQAAKLPDNVHLAVRVALAYAVWLLAYLLFQPAEIGMKLFYFGLTAGIGMPAVLAADDAVRRFTPHAIVIRSLVSLAASIAFTIILVDLRDFIPWSVIYLAPFVSAAISDRVRRDLRKKDT
ncbi:MAG: hypothetical protein RIN56_02780 [Sporomusaceae bacterium]|nr:hypothetical protein [Sporomusaceae bacterium]